MFGLLKMEKLKNPDVESPGADGCHGSLDLTEFYRFFDVIKTNRAADGEELLSC